MQAGIRCFKIALKYSRSLAETKHGPSLKILTTNMSSQSEPSTPSLAEEPWQPDEIRKYEAGKHRLSVMMGCQSLTEKEIEKTLHYLLPTRLTANDARPFLKHPSKVFDKRKESAFDISGRPLEPAFYTGIPSYHNIIYDIYEMRQSLDNQREEDIIEVSDKKNEPVKFWVKKKAMANILAAEISDDQYRDVVNRLSELASHPRASTITDFLDKFRRHHFSQTNISKTPEINNDGHIRTVGRRKCSVAVVHLTPQKGGVTVNSEPLLSYFPLPEQRQQILYPLITTDLLNDVTINALVRGGGKTGQAGAIRLGISKALLGLPGNHHSILQETGLLVRDPRAVERKKPGQKKARKKFTWVKR